MSNRDGRCVNCGHETPEALYGLKKCVACIQDMVSDFVVVDAFARAVAALMRDVVEEHGKPACTSMWGCQCDDCVTMNKAAAKAKMNRVRSETITGEQLDCIGGCGKRHVRGPQDIMFICKACAPTLEAAHMALDARISAMHRSTRPIAGRVPQMPEPNRVADIVKDMQAAKALLDESAGIIGKTNCRTCSAELLSDTSRARGTCYDCSEAR